MTQITITRMIGIVILVIFTSGCDNFIARQLGGTINVNLPTNTKLVNVTWKEGDLWLLTRPAYAGEAVETFRFEERSMLGVLQGTVTITETK